MLIGEVAERSGVSTKTLRYYEDIGVLAPPERTPAGYREFDHDVLDRLTFIRAAQVVGLSLAEIRGIIAVRDDGETPCGHALDLLRTRAREIDKTIRELRSIQRDLRVLLQRAEHLDPEDCDPRRVCHVIAPTT